MTKFIYRITCALFIKGMFLIPVYSMEHINDAISDGESDVESFGIPTRDVTPQRTSEAYSDGSLTDIESISNFSPGTSPSFGGISIPNFWVAYGLALEKEINDEEASEIRREERKKSIILEAAENMMKALNDEEAMNVEVVKKEGGGKLLMAHLDSPNSPSSPRPVFCYKRTREKSREEVQLKRKREKEAIFKAVEILVSSRGEQELWDDLEKIDKGEILTSHLLPSAYTLTGMGEREEKRQLRKREIILQTIREALNALCGEETRNVSILEKKDGGQMLMIHAPSPGDYP